MKKDIVKKKLIKIIKKKFKVKKKKKIIINEQFGKLGLFRTPKITF